jgi:membrane protease YdiL (CAAX protease family)
VALISAGHPSQGNYFISFLLGQPCLAGMAVWRRRDMVKNSEPIARLWEGPKLSQVVVGLAVGALMAGTSLLYYRLMIELMGEHDHSDRFRQSTSFLAVLKIIVGVSVGPVCEEIFFRGAMLGAFVASGRRGWGILISALLFSAMHLNPVNAPILCLHGIIFAGLFLSMRSLLAPIIAHATLNAVMFASRGHSSEQDLSPLPADRAGLRR